MRFLRAYWLDAIAILIAVIYGLPSLLYPFGLDQEIMAYVASGWLDGFWPYVDSVEHKPPGIFLVYAASFMAFGVHEMSPRILDLFCVLLTGWAAASVLRASAPQPKGTTGLLILWVSGYYYTTFGFWDTAQCEIWMALCLTLAWRLSTKPANLGNLLGTGFLVGLALLFKYTAVLVALVPFALCLLRAWNRRERLRDLIFDASLFVAGGVIVAVAVLGPFLVNGLFADFWEVTVAFNLHYAGMGMDWSKVPRSLLTHSISYTAVFLSGLIVILITKSYRRHGQLFQQVLILLALSYATVLLQKKLYLYHYSIMTPFVALLLLLFVDVLSRTPWQRLVISSSCVIALLIFSPGRDAFAQRETVKSAMDHLRNPPTDRKHLQVPGAMKRFSKRGQGLIRAINQRGRKGDTLCVIGSASPIYFRTGLRCPSRFAFSHVLAGRRGKFANGKWRDEYLLTLEQTAPTFFVTESEKSLASSLREQRYTLSVTEEKWELWELNNGTLKR